MRPVLFQIGGLHVTSYGVSKALAALVAGWLLARELRRQRLDPELAYPLTLAAVAGGFAGAKLNFLTENATTLTVHDLGGTGFTWYGGLIGGTLAVLLVARRARIAPGLMAGMAVIPLSVGYAIGRLGCQLAGDGTYGKPSHLPWAMSFPHGEVPTLARVHPTALYEAIGALLLAGVLWRVRDRVPPAVLFGLWAILAGVLRFLVEFLRLNPAALAGLTEAQFASLALATFGATVIALRRRRGRLAAQAA